MNCWHCNTKLIWGGDHDVEDWKDEEYSMETNLSCPECGSFVLVYLPKTISKEEENGN
jgi:DNA-directed RNA polymerase subunit RPC12/RpoP